MGPFLSDESISVEAGIAGGVVTFTGRVDRWSTDDLAIRLTRQVPGVVGVVDELEFAFDDRDIFGPATILGVA